MKLKVGDKVTRKSYNHDTVFVIVSINEDDVCILNGVNVRLVADSDIDDLELLSDAKVVEEENEFISRIKTEDLERDDYFYLPGKILHIDSDISLSNNLLNPYKIREKAKIQKYINHQKKQKMSKI